MALRVELAVADAEFARARDDRHVLSPQAGEHDRFVAVRRGSCRRACSCLLHAASPFGATSLEVGDLLRGRGAVGHRLRSRRPCALTSEMRSGSSVRKWTAPGRPQFAALIWAASIALFGPCSGRAGTPGRSACAGFSQRPAEHVRKWRFFSSRSPRGGIQERAFAADEPLVASTM